jgi:hypothetical protein
VGDLAHVKALQNLEAGSERNIPAFLSRLSFLT